MIITMVHTITGKGIAYARPFDSKLPLRPVEVEFENSRCCLEVINTSNSTIEFSYGHEMAYFDARIKGLVQINNSTHFLLDQYLQDRVTPATLSPKLLALWIALWLWITYIPLPLNEYGYECESTNLATICRSCIPR